jgi:dolichyl-phosphate-mannose--protein O-mannosyl transferase
MAVGWLPVLTYVAVCIAFDQSDVITIGYGLNDSCWITDNKAKLYFFGIPALMFTVFNLVFFSMTVKAIKQTRSQTRLIADQLEKKRDFGIYVRIASLMGFAWIFGFAAPFGWQILLYPFVVLNSLQGVYIALAFGLGKCARKLYVDLYRGKRTMKGNRQSTSSGRQERSTKESLL